MKADFTQQAAYGTPAVFGSILSVLTLNQWVALATGLYVVLQILYLGRKWWREEKDWLRKRRSK